jgi:hypothetical protein
VIRVGAYPTKSIQLVLTWSGCWEALAAFEGKAVAGPVVIDWRGWQLRGEVDASRSGLFAGEPAAVIVGGLAWTTRREWRPFQSDRGLTAREVALSVASQLERPIEVSLDRHLGRSFVPRRESGGAILTRLFGKAWHVGTDGTARAKTRGTPALGKSVSVLDFDPRDGRAPVYADRPDAVPIGAILPLDARLTTRRQVTKLVATASGDKERLVCYTETPGAQSTPGLITGQIQPTVILPGA